MDFDIFEMEREVCKISDIKVYINVVKNGRSKNTYISGWDLTHNELIKHLQIIKKMNGCNGSVKDGVIHLQGIHTQSLKNYMIKNGLFIESIIIKDN